MLEDGLQRLTEYASGLLHGAPAHNLVWLGAAAVAAPVLVVLFLAAVRDWLAR